MEWLNKAAAITVYVVWFWGALSLACALACLGSHLAWRVFVGVKGWNTIRLALKHYRSHLEDVRQSKGAPA